MKNRKRLYFCLLWGMIAMMFLLSRFVFRDESKAVEAAYWQNPWYGLVYVVVGIGSLIYLVDRYAYECGKLEGSSYFQKYMVCGTCADWQTCKHTEAWRRESSCSGENGVYWKPRMLDRIEVWEMKSSDESDESVDKSGEPRAESS